MKKRIIARNVARNTAILAALSVVLAGGCIVSDHVATIVLQADGSAEWMRYLSNIRSTEAGAKGAEELRQFVAEFDARRDGDLQRVVEAGGEIVEARWLRREEPYASIAVARFPGASSMLNFFTIRGEKGEVVAAPRFILNGTRRKLSIEIPIPKDAAAGESAQPTLQTLRQEQASGISETRVIVAAGRIVDSQGFTVAADRRSALLEPAKVRELLQSRPEKLVLFLEWELADN